MAANWGGNAQPVLCRDGMQTSLGQARCLPGRPARGYHTRPDQTSTGWIFQKQDALAILASFLLGDRETRSNVENSVTEDGKGEEVRNSGCFFHGLGSSGPG